MNYRPELNVADKTTPPGPVQPARATPALEPARLPGESARAYARFLTFLRIGPQRTLPQVAAKLGVSLFSTEKMSAKYDWFMRAEDFDARMEAINSELWQAQQREAAQRRAQNELTRQQTFADLAAKFARKIDLLLDTIGLEQVEKQMKDGTTKRVLQAKGIGNLVSIAVFTREYQRLACLAVIDKVEEFHAKIRKPEEATGPEAGEILPGEFSFGGRLWGGAEPPEPPADRPAPLADATTTPEAPMPPAFVRADEPKQQALAAMLAGTEGLYDARPEE